MAIASRTESIAMPGGGQMHGHLSLPETGSGPAVLVLMEIFGVGPYIRRATERLAELGYVALAPDLYRRVEPGLVITDRSQEGVSQAMAAAQRLDPAGAVQDAMTALEHLRSMPEVSGRGTGVLGFCLGGRLAYGVAAAGSPDVAVCYYGSGIEEALADSDAITCPVLFHYGAEDQFIPVAAAQRVCAVAQQREGWECHIQPDGGHAFDNHESPIFHHPDAAARAWELTRAFLARHLR